MLTGVCNGPLHADRADGGVSRTENTLRPFVPLCRALLPQEGASDALTIRWIETELLLWRLSALALLPPTRPLWRHRKPGLYAPCRPGALSALAPALLIARAVLAVLLPMAAAQSGLWPSILRALAAWGALLWVRQSVWPFFRVCVPRACKQLKHAVMLIGRPWR